MDLPELLARVGIQPDDTSELMTWARARTSALLATLDAKSPLGQSLAPGLAHLVMRRPGPESAAHVGDMPPAPHLVTSDPAVPVPIAASRSRATARVVSRPYLGAAVEAALYVGESSGNLSSETAPVDPPPAAASFDEDEASIGGFTRFASSVRRSPGAGSERPSESRATLAHGFALHAEREASQFSELPAPPSFEPSESGIRARLPSITGIGDSERSTSLVVGIPDEDAADVPIARPRSRSAGLEATASGSLRAAVRPPSGPATTPPSSTSRADMSIELNLEIEDPELSSALKRMVPQNGETSTMLAAENSASLLRSMPEPSLQIPIHVDEDPSSEVPPRRESPPTRPHVRSRPPPPPLRNTPVAQPAPAPTPEPAAKRGRGGRKKVVELGTPVARPVTRASAPEPVAADSAPVRAAREVSKPDPAEVPNYLRDDDE